MTPGLERELEDLQRRIFRVAYMILHEQASAEDVAQETIARAIDNIESLRRRDDLWPWTYAIAINLCRAHLRAKRDGAKLVDAAALDRARGPRLRRGPLTSAMMHEAYRRAAAAVAGLPSGLREVFVLHYVEDMAYETVARVCGITEGAARLRAMRARNELQQELAAMLDPEVRLRMESEPVTPPAGVV